MISSSLEAWGNFYVIVGSSAGALTGLQFVVMTLIAQADASRTRGETISAFGTPNVVHFCAALLVAAILSVPWTGVAPAGFAVAVCGGIGEIYSIIVARRAGRQKEYKPVFEDWLWHAVLPILAYLAMLVAGLGMEWAPGAALLAVGAATLLLVFVGIHNAWDTVTFLMLRSSTARREGGATASNSGASSATASGVATAGATAASEGSEDGN